MKVEGGRLFVNLGAGSNRHKTPHEPHPLSRKVERSPGPLRFAGISASERVGVRQQCGVRLR
jgi:hypothetical protein